MKKFLFPLLISLYLIQATLLLATNYKNLKLLVIPGLFIVFAAVLAFINIGCAIFSAGKILTDRAKQKAMNRTVLLFKLLAIPFYALNFLIWTSATGLFMVMPGNIFFLLLIVPMGIIFAYLVLLAASSYSIALLLSLKKSGAISAKKFIIHTILQLIFFVDVIDQFIVLKYVKRSSDLSA